MKWSPCYKCTDREIGCHDKCSKYRKYRKVIEKANKASIGDNQFVNYRADVFGGR